MRAFAKTPTGQSIPLVQIDDGGSGREDVDDLAEPINLPKGTTIVVESADPSQAPCLFGVATKDPAHLQPLLRHNRLANAER